MTTPDAHASDAIEVNSFGGDSQTLSTVIDSNNNDDSNGHINLSHENKNILDNASNQESITPGSTPKSILKKKSSFSISDTTSQLDVQSNIGVTKPLNVNEKKINSPPPTLSKVKLSRNGSTIKKRIRSRRNGPPVGYACNTTLIRLSNRLPSNIGRAILVHTLIHAYKLFTPINSNIGQEQQIRIQSLLRKRKRKRKSSMTKNERFNDERQCMVLPVYPLSNREMTQYHDPEFIKFITELDNAGDEYEQDDNNDEENESEDTDDEKSSKPLHLIPYSLSRQQDERQQNSNRKMTSKLMKRYEQFGVEYDCPYFEGISDYVSIVAGASVACANYVIKRSLDQEVYIYQPPEPTDETKEAVNSTDGEKNSDLNHSNGDNSNDTTEVKPRVRFQLPEKPKKIKRRRDDEGKQDTNLGNDNFKSLEHDIDEEEEDTSEEEDDDDELQQPIAINWQGGRHHAKKAKCAGFCYINDAVLCIQRLRSKFNKVLYLDLDLHHGDGVETAFSRTNKVACVSIHRYDRGFYPGTPNGSLEYMGGGESGLKFAKQGSNIKGQSFPPGYGYTLNIPTQRGLSGKSLDRIFKEIIDVFVVNYFKPDAIVVVVGCDGLARDEHAEWNLEIKDYERVIREYILDKWNLPTVFLGGGGYHHTDTARCWTFLTASILGRNDQYKWDDIPEHHMLQEYAQDGYRFHIDTKNEARPDENEGEYLDNMISLLQKRFEHFKFI